MPYQQARYQKNDSNTNLGILRMYRGLNKIIKSSYRNCCQVLGYMFDNNLRIGNDFTKYLNERCWKSSE